MATYEVTMYGGKKITVEADDAKEARHKVWKQTGGAVMRSTRRVGGYVDKPAAKEATP